MRTRAVLILAAFTAVAAACTTSGSAPATAPPTTPPQQTTATSSTSTTASTLAPTTTVDRIAEVTTILDDLETLRLQAISERDREKFESVYANREFLEESLPAFEAAEVTNARGFATLDLGLLVDSDDCVAADVTRDYSSALRGGGIAERVVVVEFVDGAWGYSWIGEGWLCEGSHPLDS